MSEQFSVQHILTEPQLCYFSRQFSNMFGLPVRLYRQQEEIYTYSPVQLAADPVTLCIDALLQETAPLGYFSYHDMFYYGYVRHQSYCFVAGPVSELAISEHELKKLGGSLHLEPEQFSVFAAEMKTLSGMHPDTLLQAMILYNFTVNRTMYDISDLRILQREQKAIAAEMKENEILSNPESRNPEGHMRSLSVEQDIIRKVQQGDVDGLIDGATKIPAVRSGQLAPQLLRHHKNFFIRLETIVSRAAIQAGLSAEEVLETEERYISKCESLPDMERIKNLQYHMILDYADQVRKLKQCGGSQSRLVRNVLQYIRSHMAEPIRTADIAAYCGKSRGGLTMEFKKQTGRNLSDFIQQQKMQEAETLLLKTEQNLSQISSLLGFSSQSHFTRVFKEVHGMTPTEFRKSQG